MESNIKIRLASIEDLEAIILYMTKMVHGR